jgi:formate dehydrogenase accessory protein FdhD
MDTEPLRRVPVQRSGPSHEPAFEEVPEERPVALSVNGVSQVVMMLTPQDLEDFAYGFALSEGWVQARHQVLDVELLSDEGADGEAAAIEGLVLEMQLSAECSQALQQRRRSLAGRSGCGLCGIDSLAALMPPPRRAAQPTASGPDEAALCRAAQQLAQRQPWHARTGGLHAAAWALPDGSLCEVREDIGRHNALDKLLGARFRQSQARFDEGFVLVSSRMSYELVHKAAMAGIPALASVSAPTAQAIRSAQASGIALWAFVREGRATRYA